MSIIDTVVGGSIAIFSVYLGSRFAISRDKIESFNQAAQKFRGAFWDEIQVLDRKYLVDRASAPSTAEILFEAVGKHQEAIASFRPYLSWYEKIAFDKAWEAYCSGGSNIHYFTEKYPPDGLHKDEQYSQKALSRITRLLSFTKPK